MGFMSGAKLIVGYDLGNDYCQISYCVQGQEEVETLSQVPGLQSYNIPTVLCKKHGDSQWFFGKEALKQAEGQQGILVSDLLAQALDGEAVLIDGEPYDPAALLSLFVKRSLGLLAQLDLPDKIGGIMFTCRVLDERMMELIGRIIQSLGIRSEKVSVQDHTESYYCYMLHQPKDLWLNQIQLLHHDKSCIRSYRMERNRKTRPEVVYIEEKVYPWQMPSDQEEADRKLLRIAMDCCEERLIGSVFLIGEGFDSEWMKDSLRYLCRNRRVFQGVNLFVKGACHAMADRLDPKPQEEACVFLGKEKLKANVGMKLYQGKEEVYCPILNAGVNWYEAKAALEFYVQDTDQLDLLITPLTGQQPVIRRMKLLGLAGTPARLSMQLTMAAENQLRVCVEDLGFGEVRAAAGKTWSEEMDLY